MAKHESGSEGVNRRMNWKGIEEAKCEAIRRMRQQLLEESQISLSLFFFLFYMLISFTDCIAFALLLLAGNSLTCHLSLLFAPSVD